MAWRINVNRRLLFVIMAQQNGLATASDGMLVVIVINDHATAIVCCRVTTFADSNIRRHITLAYVIGANSIITGETLSSRH